MRLFHMCLGAAAACILLVSCDKDEGGTAAPALTVSSAVITAATEGGSYSFTYSVANRTSDGETECYTDVTWLTDAVCSSGTVSFTATENTGGSRTGNVSLVYSSSAGVVSETVAVRQNSALEPEISAPVSVTAGAGGGSRSFSYQISNSTADGEFFCTSEDEWIYGFDYSVDGKVSFTVAENGGEELRSGLIEAIYLYDNGSMVSRSVAVVQDHEGGLYGNFGLSDLVGTYTANGLCYVGDSTVGEKTWTLSIYPYSSTEVLIDGLVPECEGTYPSEMYLAKACLNDEGQMVIEGGYTGYAYVSGSGIFATSYYIGWLPCLEFSDGKWYYNPHTTEGAMTFDVSTGSWTGDYGWFLGLFYYENDLSSFFSFLDVTNPGFTITKTSPTPAGTLAPDNVEANPLVDLPLHTEFRLGELGKKY